MKRDPWEDLAGELESAAAFVRRRGAAIEQRFYEWQKIGQIPRTAAPCPMCDGDGCEDCHGTGNAPAASPNGDGREDRQASRQLHHFRLAVADLAVKLQRVRSFEQVAFPKGEKLEPRHLTVTQVEADGWCGSHWRIGEFVPIATRQSGEPFYRGRCRRCGEWPGGDPPVEVLQAWKSGRSMRVAAS